jgi:hypothetical protein
MVLPFHSPVLAASGAPTAKACLARVHTGCVERVFSSLVSTFMADEALIRWEEMRREHLGAAIAVLFGLSSASLAYCGSLLTEDSVKLGAERTTYFLTAVGFFSAAVFLSLLVTLTRLKDVRTTADIVRKRGDPNATAEVTQLRTRARCWGWLTRWLFRLLVLAFSCGACFLLIALWHIFHGKIFP